MMPTPVQPICLLQPIDYDLLGRDPRTGGLSVARHEQCRAVWRELRSEFPNARGLVDRGCGVPTREFTIGYAPREDSGVMAEVGCGVLGPRQADRRLLKLENKTPSVFCNAFWRIEGIRDWYLGEPPVDMAVSSHTEAKDFLGSLVRPGDTLWRDMRTAVPNVAIDHYCAANNIGMVGEPHGPAANPQSVNPALVGIVSKVARLQLIVGGDRRYTLHPKGNFAVIDLNDGDNARRVALCLWCLAHDVSPVVDILGWTKGERAAVFGWVGNNVPTTTTTADPATEVTA